MNKRDKVPNSIVELKFTAKNISKSYQLTVTSPPNSLYTAFSTKDCKKKDKSAKFIKSFFLNYHIDEKKEYRFGCGDGHYDTTIKSILSKPYKIETGDLLKGDNIIGQIEISAEEIPYSNNDVYVGIQGKNLDSKDLNGKSDPFFKVYKKDKYGKKQLVYESEVQKKTLDPNFNYISMTLARWCSCDLSRELTFKVYDWNLIGKSEFIGKCKLTTEQFLDKKNSEFTIISKREKPAGYLQFHTGHITKKFNLNEYLAGNCDISVMVAIDCSSSSSKKKYHHYSETEESKYGSAMFKVASEFLQFWPSNGSIEVLGFGGIIPDTDHKSYCFPFSFDPNSSFVKSPQELFALYYDKIDEIVPCEPTNLSEIIKYAANKSIPPPDLNQEQFNQKYNILVIFTDGDIDDMDQSLRSLIDASELPLSISIIQVGNDYDSNKLYNLENYSNRCVLPKGIKRPDREIVKQINHQRFHSPMFSLENEVMSGIERQLTSYFMSKKIDPNPPINPNYITIDIPQ